MKETYSTLLFSIIFEKCKDSIVGQFYLQVFNFAKIKQKLSINKIIGNFVKSILHSYKNKN